MAAQLSLMTIKKRYGANGSGGGVRLDLEPHRIDPAVAEEGAGNLLRTGRLFACNNVAKGRQNGGLTVAGREHERRAALDQRCGK